MWQPTEYDRWYAMQLFRPDIDRLERDSALLRLARDAVLEVFGKLGRGVSPRAHLIVEAKLMAKEGFSLPEGFRFEGFSNNVFGLYSSALGGGHPTDEACATLHNRLFLDGLRRLSHDVDVIAPSMTAIEKAAAGQTGQVITIGTVTESSMHAAVVAFGITLLGRIWSATIVARDGTADVGRSQAKARKSKGLDPTDLAILRALREGKDIAKQIADSAKSTEGTVRRRMQGLKQRGLVEGEKPYRLTRHGVEAVAKGDQS